MNEEKTVRPERTGWRDNALSLRHREWGWDCPALDVDFVLIEYDKGEAAALIDYKSEHAPDIPWEHPTYRALAGLASCASIPCFEVKYKENFSAYKVRSLNYEGYERLHQYCGEKPRYVFAEYQYVEFLYWLRGMEMPEEVAKKLLTPQK